LRAIDVEAASFFPNHPFGYPAADYSVVSSNPVSRLFGILDFAFRRAAAFDVIQFHFARSFLPEAWSPVDARYLRARGRRVVMEYWGSEVRSPTLERQRNPYYVLTQGESDLRGERTQRWAEITGGHCIVGDHFAHNVLERYFPHIHVVGQRIDIQRFLPHYPNPENRLPVLVHAPSHLETKGTRFVREAVERLQAKGLPFVYREVHGVKQSEALEIYAQADLIVDQLRLGGHGVFAVEAMALGKPVICYVLPELEQTYPEGFPIINANPDTLEGVLEQWLQMPEERYRRGVESRAYAERVHDMRVVARKLLAVYEQLP
jgi:hypothetical protein